MNLSQPQLLYETDVSRVRVSNKNFVQRSLTERLPMRGLAVGESLVSENVE